MDARRLTVTLVDGTRVVVPDSLELITPYVLQEQHDWFEDEIRFVRVLLEPGDRALDIGANYGVYTLSMAHAVGPAGHVWAFEPASHPADFLELSIAENGFPNVTLDRRAVSNAPGTAQLAVQARSELNALVRGDAAATASETVRLTSLDECLEMYAWDDIGFVKIDAEGEEANIVAGGRRFFDALSPLVQYEVKAGADLHFELAETFAASGYGSYRLVPALNLLVPFDGRDADPDLLNLFACKPDRATALAARGLLVRTAPSPSDREACLREVRERFPRSAADALVRLVSASARESHALEEALALHALSRDRDADPSVRLCALEMALQALTRLCEHRPTALRRSSAARAAFDLGAMRLAVDHLSAIVQRLTEVGQIDGREPFLAPSLRFEAVERRGSLRDWLLAAALDTLGRSCAYSSFFDAEGEHARLALVDRLGYADDEVQRRLTLLQRRAAAREAAAG
ncbi:MAG TPA: FkbM family methyltransferase [Burkholderiales bacterium]|nr:FkbM family methyltransferase [Burkholderiales bacterium]